MSGTTAALHSTIVGGNTALTGDGGGIFTYLGAGSATPVNSTFVGNVADSDLAGGGTGESLHVSDGSIDLHDTLRVSTGGDECAVSAGTLLSGGHNLADDVSCLLNAAGDLPSTQPKVGPLLNDGGPTLTHALLPSSPAIDAGDAGFCPSNDQRGD